MMLANIEARETHGQWDDEGAVHPIPTINEPQKAVCWLTPDEDMDDARKADLHLRSGLGRVDNVFLKTRHLVNAFAEGKKRVRGDIGKRQVATDYTLLPKGILVRPQLEWIASHEAGNR